ncbi:DEAD/DEAH box helicase family protein [Herbaspirillum sp. YR522]|uniref:DEAD/DEAH box helicase family protein n=1 Tax=Herbaspirillum sp. YR522 TaxID=1144342 RepID=UPI00026FB303|nr:DEAD/DEAH box helicase family protein [Herbaspirillum sp. YR522]EJN09816.1 helicase family protein [Herbaspirillum sp. YR522]
MNSPVLRANPAKISTTLKEAVVDALLNMTHAYSSGAGDFGKYLFGARPRTLLTSGFLLPMRNEAGDDEVTSPIWISSHGLQLQVANGVGGDIIVRPNLSVYVRVLPEENDLKRPNCKLSFRLRREIFLAAREAIRNRQNTEWEKIKGSYKVRYKHPEWARIREEIRTQVYTERGLPLNLSELSSDEPADSVTDDDRSVVTMAVDPNDKNAPVVGRDEDFEPLSIPHKWLRLDFLLPELKFTPAARSAAIALQVDQATAQLNAAIAEHLRAWADGPEGRMWGYRHMPVTRSQYQNWKAFLDQVRASTEPVILPDIALNWHVRVTKDWLDRDNLNVFIALENRSNEPRTHADDSDQAVFQVELETTVPPQLHRSLKLERVEPSYRYNAYLQYPAMGHNGGVRTVTKDFDNLVLRTTWTPRYVQPRIVPTSSANINRHVRSLSQPDGLSGLLPIVSEFQKWIDEQPSKIDLSAGLHKNDVAGLEREKGKFDKDMQKWRDELTAIKAGLDILQESRAAWSVRGTQSDPKAVVYEAWLAMNEAIANFMQRRFKNDNGEWRLFQLAFIVANIPALASRIPEFRHHYNADRDDSVTLLYFATGGGKSEAFFGLLVFNLLLDRLRGKYVGVTAMIRYPLRLLTIQQAQRCSKVLAQAELVRKNYGYHGAPLSIGFWVGSGGSPNNHATKGITSIPEIDVAHPSTAAENKLRQTDQKYDAACKAWNKIPECPFCGTATALRRFPGMGGTLGHVCTDLQCASNGGVFQPLPFYICDEDIYDFAPSVLLGTVDKLALIGHSSGTIRRIYGMLGAAPWRRKDTKRLVIPSQKELAKTPNECDCEGLWPAYPSGVRLFHDPFPSLLIQDEAHLLDESLGTFAGLFESALDAVFQYLHDPLTAIVAKDLGHHRRRAKVIAASATVNDPERQLEHLYQRKIPASQFPHPGPMLYDSFYAQPEEPNSVEVDRVANPDPEVRSPQARVYCGFMTNGKPHTATSVAILSNFHLCISTLFEGLVNGDTVMQQQVAQALQNCISPGPLQQLHRQALAIASVREIATLIDLHRIALTYVTNKKGGDQIMAAEMEESRKRHLNADVPLESLDTRLITGSVDQGEVQAVVEAAQKRDKPDTEFTPLSKVLRSVIATSAISHGVDVEEFNSMFFAGMPSDIAEYIQASSRVGRTHIGFVVLIPTPQRRRDRYIVEVFDIFHRFLERMVQPAAIDRWAEKAVERVFPSMLQAYLVGIVPTCEVIKLPENEKTKTSNYTWVPEITKAYNVRKDAFIADITRFIELAIGLRQGHFPEGEEHYRRMIFEKTRHLLNQWANSTLYGSAYLRDYFNGQTDTLQKPMTSLRDVDQGGEIRMSPKDADGKKQTGSQVFAVMDLVRNGVAENDDDEA